MPLPEEKIPDHPTCNFNLLFSLCHSKKEEGKKARKILEGEREGKVRGRAKTRIAGRMHLRIAVFAGQRFNNYRVALKEPSQVV